MNASAYGFLAGLGQKISATSGDDRETCYLFQRISVDVCCRLQVAPSGERYESKRRPGRKQRQTTAGYMA